MKMLSYFDPIPGQNWAIEYRVMLRWRKEWLNRGFDAHILTEQHASSHPIYKELCERITRIQSTNLPLTRASLMRWLAAATAVGAKTAFLSHYDVIPWVKEWKEWYGKKDDCLYYHEKPIFIASTGQGFISRAALFLEDCPLPDLPTDVNWLPPAKVLDVVKDFDRAGEDSQLVSFAGHYDRLVETRTQWPVF